MQVYWTLVRRELGAYFFSLTGYFVIAMVLFLLGLSFMDLLIVLNNEPTDLPLTELFYQTVYFWLILLLASPVITMRLFALEKFAGTFETLMTTPVSDLQVVLAKFTSAWVFYGLMWVPLLGCIYILRQYTGEPALWAPGPIASTFLGILLIGGFYMAIGCFASSLTRNQIISAMNSLAIGITFFMLSFLSVGLSPESGWWADVFAYISMVNHMQDFVRGTIDTRHLVYYLSLIVFFLFLTLKVIESRRWK